MKKSRKKRIDSVTAEGEMMRSKAPLPPDHVKLTAKEWPFWQSIINARDFSSWSVVDLEQAANLARCKCDIEKLQKQMRREKDIVTNAAGSPIINPKHKLIQDLTRRAIALSRLLHVHAEATVGESRHQRERNARQREMQNLQELDPLFAKPIQ